MARVICPFCLKPHDFTRSEQCPESNQTVPNVYIREYNKVPPLWLATVGFPKHGKTTYLTALTLMIEKINWQGIFYRYLDQYTQDEIQKMRREAIDGIIPKSTPHPDNASQKVSRPMLFSVYNMPESGSRCLVMYDVAGEVFDSLNEVQNYVPSIKQVSTIWFLVSLKDLQENKDGRMITDLFTVYLSGLEKLRVNLSGRNLIVIYTKADEVAFTPDVKAYIRTDPFQAVTLPEAENPALEMFSFYEYVDGMQNISNELRDYTTRRVPGGPAFINMVEANGMNLVFCATSALGQSPDDGNTLSVNARRYRVLDPFLWAITLDGSGGTRSLNLIADASQDSQPIYENDLLDNIWEQLSDYGDLTTYFLGQNTPASQPGQQPPKLPPNTFRQRLIGPLLEKASSQSQFVIIATGPILDLLDFSKSSWRDRLLLINVGEDHQPNWSNKIVFREGDDPMVLVNATLQMSERSNS